MDPFALATLLTDLEADQREALPVGNTLCHRTVELVGVSAAGITLISSEGHYGSFGASDPLARAAEELQYTLEEGPCVEAHLTQESVVEPDLQQGGPTRWPRYTEGALAVGIRAVFGFPLVHERSSLGALDLYQRQPGSLTEDQVVDATIMGEVITHTVLALQKNVPVGHLAPEIGAAFDQHAVLHQASGLVAGELGLPLPDAYIRIRAVAYTQKQPVTEVAEAIVRRELRLS